MFSVNRFAIRDHIGDWQGGDTLMTRCVGDEDGKQVVETITVELTDHGHMAAHVVESIDDTVMLTTELTLERTDG